MHKDNLLDSNTSVSVLVPAFSWFLLSYSCDLACYVYSNLDANLSRFLFFITK